MRSLESYQAKNYNHTVPRLVSKYQPIQKIQIDLSNRLRQSSITTSKQYESIQRDLIRQIQQNQELRNIIQQLKEKSDQLKDINKQLLARLKQMQNQYRNSFAQFQQLQQENKKKFKAQIYNQIQSYLKYIIVNFQASLKKQKMNQKVEDKIEAFLEELLQINSVLVTQHSKKKFDLYAELQISNNSSHNNLNINPKSKSNQKQRYYSNSPNKQQYQFIISRMKQQEIRKQSEAMFRFYPYPNIPRSPNSQKKKYQVIEQPRTPHQRKRIFND